MSWDQIFIVALAGGIGAVGGIVLGWLLSPLLKKTGDGAARSAGGVLVIAGAIAGYAFLPGQIEPLVQPRLDRMAAGDTPQSEVPAIAIVEPEIPEAEVQGAIDRAMAGLNDPFMDAVFAREPGRAEQVRSRLGAAYRRGGEAALLDALLAADQEILQVSFPYYMARAEGDDLLAAVRQIRVVIAALSEHDPMTCHAWLYGAMSGEAFDFDAYLAAIGPERHLALQTRLAAVVEGAEDILPEYDEAYAMAVLDEVRVALNEELGDEKVGLIMSAQAPESMADARLACDASGDYYDMILEDARSVEVFRHRYSGGEEYR